MTRALIRRVLCAALAAVVGFLCASCSGTTVVDTPSASATLPPASPRYAAPAGDGDMTYVASLPLYLPSRDGKRLIARLADVPLDRSEPAARAVVQALLTAPADDNVPSLGRMIQEAQSAFIVYPWEFWPPVAVASTITISLCVLGQNLADATDPRTHM